MSFGIDQGQKTALVGINGSGKSTLLKIIAGEETAEEGKVSFRKDIRVAFLGQNPHFEENETVREWIFSSDNEALSVIKEYEYHLERANDPESQKKLEQLIEKIDQLNAWDYESQIKQILGQLNIYQLERTVNSLSGGQRKRVALARTLIEKPDFLILDEPTNHLDIETIEWLENYLATQNMSLLLVTHDRFFLERVTNDIIELDQGKTFRYKGNYSYFLDKKAERMEQEAAEVEKARNLMRKEQEWIRRQPKARGTKAKYRIEAFQELKSKASKKIEKAELDINVRMSRQGKKILEVEHLKKSFDEKTIISDFSYIFKRKERIGIIGPNGAGKSTFLNLLTGKTTADNGLITSGITTKFGYYTQAELEYKEDQRVIDLIKEIAEVVELGDGNTVSASQFLEHFLFPPEMQYSPISKLSGGEKKRLQLMKVLVTSPNFLILDEPTNDLDLITLEVLEDFLENFNGCLLLVSHDRYFMDRLVDHSFVFEGNGQIKDYPGNYTHYRQLKAEKEKKQKEKEQTQQIKNEKPKDKPKGEKRKLSYKEQREFEQIEGELEKLEIKKAELEEKLNAGSENYEELSSWGKELEDTNQLIEEKSDRWLELSEFA
ncbi:ABC transporter ATP-binding protein [Cytophagales bacterium RKSG123]|nr:ABC transporter ATP-binding protein [Xanthovirga aplysinae]